MNQIHWNLSILTKSVHHKNLSAAADHVGLSQPQLSRIIAKLEEELKVVLLDRSVRRKSGWTKAAFELAEVYSRNEHKLQADIQRLTTNQITSSLAVGTLEGLSNNAIEFCKKIFDSTPISYLRLDIYDISDLEEHFESSDLDLIFSFRIPGRQKYKNVIEVGYQAVDQVETSTEFAVMSPFEYTKLGSRSGHRPKGGPDRFFVSNSLSMRRYWLDNFGGTGSFPSKVSKTKGKNQEAVFLVGSDLMSPLLWASVEKASK